MKLLKHGSFSAEGKSLLGRVTSLLTSPHFFTAVLLIFLLSVLGLIRDPSALDSGRVPRLVALLVFLATALCWAFASPLRDKLDWSAIRHPIIYAFSAYVIFVWVSLAFAINPSAGLIDAVKSGATLLVLGLCVVCFRSSNSWRLVWIKTGVISSLIFGAYTQFQFIKQDIWKFWGNDWIAFFYWVGQKSTFLFGNINLLSSFFGLLLPICISGILVSSRLWKVAALVAVINNSFLILILSSRSIWLGEILMVSLLILLFLLKINFFLPNKRIRILFFVSFFLFILIFLLFIISLYNKNISTKLDSLSPVAITQDNSYIARIKIWRNTLSLIGFNLYSGVGAGNWTLRIPEYSRGNILVEFSDNPEKNWIQPHNDYLWILAEKGLLGIAAFLAIFIFAWIAGIRTILQAKTPEVAWTAFAALGGLTVYMVDSLFSFPLDRVNHQMVLAVLLAALAASDKFPAALSICKQNNRRALAVGVPASVVILATGFIISIASLRQEHHVALAREAMKQKHWNTMLQHARLAKTPLRTLDNYAVPVSFLEGFALMKKGKVDEPIKLLEQAQKESPGRYFILNNLGILYSLRGDYTKAVALFQNLAERYPNRSEARQNLELSLKQKNASETSTPPNSQATEITNSEDLFPSQKIQTTLSEIRNRVEKYF